MTLADALEAHAAALGYGGRLGIASIDGLQGALGRPYHGYHRRIHEKASAVLHGVATSHAFIDENKRTALLLTLLLVDRSGYDLTVPNEERIDDIVVNLVDGTISEAACAEWLRLRLART